MGTIQIYDARPSRIRGRWVDARGNGPLLLARSARTPLPVGSEVELPDGSTWPVVRSRQTMTLFGWRQEVTVGVLDEAGSDALDSAALDSTAQAHRPGRATRARRAARRHVA